MDCGKTGLTFQRPSKVRPQFAADCDISNIVRKFIRTGELPKFVERPNIGDASAYPSDYQVLQDTIVAARQSFEVLPPEERNKYNNSVENWLESKLSEIVDSPAAPPESSQAKIHETSPESSQAKIQETSPESSQAKIQETK